MCLNARLFADTTILASLKQLQALGVWTSIRWRIQENEKIFLFAC
ncbi:hypothetical protein SynROS8604_02609 [Synechococcus sp. ROS8604]|nr:hypothetical protein SynROS8604_02609 [Synechococcus sp. ROS8604]